MFTTIFRDIVTTYLRLWVAFAVGIATLAILVAPVSAEKHEANILDFCQAYIAAPPPPGIPDFIIRFDTSGAVQDIPGANGMKVPWPPEPGAMLKDVVTFQYTYWQSSEWYCYKIQGEKTCIKY